MVLLNEIKLILTYLLNTVYSVRHKEKKLVILLEEEQVINSHTSLTCSACFLLNFLLFGFAHLLV